MLNPEKSLHRMIDDRVSCTVNTMNGECSKASAPLATTHFILVKILCNFVFLFFYCFISFYFLQLLSKKHFNEMTIST